jgi:hypothetical protein
MPYQGTEFAGMAFSYVIVPAGSQDGCTKAMLGNQDAAPQEPVTINGHRFSVAADQDAARRHEIVERLYSTYTNGRCYLFALEMTKVGFGLYDGIKPVSEDQMDDAEQRMESVLRSVRIDAVR